MFESWLFWSFSLILLALVIGLPLRVSQTDWGHPLMKWLDGLNRLYCRFVHGYRGEKLELPDEGAAIVVANHISGVDPLLLSAACHRPLRFMIAREEYERFGFRWFFKVIGCIPVDREKRPEQAMREALRALEQGEALAVFPFGKIITADDPQRPIKRGVLRLSALSGAPIYPACIRGVRAQGRVIGAVFIPSKKVYLHPIPFVHATNENENHLRDFLTKNLSCIS